MSEGASGCGGLPLALQPGCRARTGSRSSLHGCESYIPSGSLRPLPFGSCSGQWWARQFLRTTWAWHWGWRAILLASSDCHRLLTPWHPFVTGSSSCSLCIAATSWPDDLGQLFLFLLDTCIIATTPNYLSRVMESMRYRSIVNYQLRTHTPSNTICRLRKWGSEKSNYFQVRTAKALSCSHMFLPVMEYDCPSVWILGACPSKVVGPWIKICFVIRLFL